jgi:NitT/TauT family transport system substrate-binding protein
MFSTNEAGMNKNAERKNVKQHGSWYKRKFWRLPTGSITVMLTGMLLVMLLIMVCLSGCSNKAEETKHLVIADQFGLAYAPIEMLKATPILAKALKAHGLDNVDVEWVRMGNTAAIREAMVAGQLDIGFVAIPPFLLGREGGMDWKIISGVSESPVGLVASAEDAGSTLKEIAGSKRIILPQLGSVQHILLAMAAEKVFGDASALDSQIVAMSHPDGMTAMTSNPGSYLHFTTPPFLEQELSDSRFAELIDGETCFGGDFTFIVGICPARVHEDQALYAAFAEALEEAIAYMNDSPDAAAALLKDAYEYPDDVIDAVLSEPGMRFTTEVNGVETFQSFMVKMGLLEKAEPIETLLWE